MEQTRLNTIPGIDQTRSKLLQLFQYVQAFNHLQNPVQRDITSQPWALWLMDLPDHPAIRTGVPALSTTQSSADQTAFDAGANENFLLKVARPRLTEPPAPPTVIAACLKSGWDDPLKALEVDPRSSFDEPQQLAFKKWLPLYNRWAQGERPARQALQIFDRIYALRTQLERETEQLELMVGDGIIRWQTRQQVSIYHPTLLVRMQLLFNPQIPEFTICETEQPPEFYSALFQGISEVNGEDLSRIRQDFELHRWHPLADEDTTQFLQRLAHHLSPKGRLEQDPSVARAIKACPNPLLFRQPVLFLRKRTLGFNTVLEAILDDIPQRQDLSYALTSLVGITTQPNIPRINTSASTIQTRTSSSPNGEDEHILLSKPANAEQLEIAQKLEQYGAVLVQGPPGTGKTHTIANLLGHLLAQGKSVLVTSHTSKALKVLHEKIVPPLQPLCVSILEDDNRKQMERAIDAITERLSTENVERLEQAAAFLTQQRIALIQQIRRDREDLKLARNSEYEMLIVDGRQYSPSEAARYLIAHHNADWITDPIVLNAPLPLSLQEFIELYHTNATVSALDEQEIVQGLPDVQQLFMPTAFKQAVQKIAELQTMLRQMQQADGFNYRRDLWQSALQKQITPSFTEIQQKLELALAFFRDEVPWKLAVIQAGQEGGMQRQIWEDLITKVESVYKLAAYALPLLLEYDPSIPDAYISDHTDKVLQEILTYLDKGKTLNGMALLMHAEWKTLLTKVRVQNHTPEIKEHFQALQVLIRLDRARKDLVGRWQRQIVPLGAGDARDAGPRPEAFCHRYVVQLQECLNWYAHTWLPLENQLKQQGFLWEKLLAELPVSLSEYDQVLQQRAVVREHLPALLAAEEQRRLYAINEKELQAIKQTLQHMAAVAGINGGIESTPLIRRIQSAIVNRDTTEYQLTYEHIADLHARQKDQQRRIFLLEKLERRAPSWAKSIRIREGIHGSATVPETMEDAWFYRQFKDELNRRARISLEDIQARIARNNLALHSVTAELVEKRSWAAQIRRTTIEQQRALQGWKELIRKVGKGSGKRAPQLLAQARELMPICQTAVPVWIMPLSRVVQNFDPRKNRFDVVIIDEASQADIKALTAIYMGAQIVIVGDHEQVTPLAVGQNLDDIDKLIHQYLTDIPLKQLYDGQLSIYKLAQTTFSPICLREHFRCVSPIIQFSNILSYDGKIKPLRDDSDVKIRPATVEYCVKSTDLYGKVNEEEAVTIASLIVAACEHDAYRDATMGVISLLYDEQALRIDMLLRRHLSAIEYTRRRLLCGNAAQFQGDERDVMFLSMVDIPRDDTGPLMMRDEDARDATAKKRFNVAASRARDQMWVVHSLNPDIHLKEGDIRKKLIMYARNPGASAHLAVAQEQRTESEFERLVMRRLLQAGYRVVPQWPVGAYRIDLVVEGNGRRLAVECDGDRWHPMEKLEADMNRQAILERLGWRFIRIRGSQFFRSPDESMQRVFERLESLEIFPEVQTVDEVVKNQDGQALKQSVIRRAAELRQQWNSDTLATPIVSTPRAATASTRRSYSSGSTLH